MMIELLALVITVNGWQTTSPGMSITETESSVHITGQGNCYIDLTPQCLPSEIEGLSLRVRGTGKAYARLMMDTEGSTYGVAQEFTAGQEPQEIHLFKGDRSLVRMAPISRGMPERMRLYIDAAEPVDITVWGIETW